VLRGLRELLRGTVWEGIGVLMDHHQAKRLKLRGRLGRVSQRGNALR